MTPRFRLFSNDDRVSRQLFNIFLTLFQQKAGIVMPVHTALQLIVIDVIYGMYIVV